MTLEEEKKGGDNKMDEKSVGVQDVQGVQGYQAAQLQSIGSDEMRLPETLFDPPHNVVEQSAAETSARDTLMQALCQEEWWDEAQRAALVADALDIVFRGKRYPPRGGSEELRFPEDESVDLALDHFGVDAYET